MYTTADKVAAFLGLTLSAGQESLITDDLEPAMSAYIDRYTGRSWGVSSPVSNELHTVYGRAVYLKNKPVVAITAVSYRSPAIGATGTALTSGDTYELLDATTGMLMVSAPLGSLLTVSYTHGATSVPADIAHAATLLVAAQLHDATLADPQFRGVKSYQVGQGDIRLDFDTEAAQGYASGALDMLKLRRSFVMA